MLVGAKKELDKLCIVLASGSPRRKQLLEEQLQLTVDVHPSTFAEDLDKYKFPNAAAYAEATAKQKALQVVSARQDADVVIAADTVVALGSSILEKPKDKKAAVAMLTSLMGRQHSVHTAVAVAFRHELPARWEMRRDPKNRAYFCDKIAEKSQWTRPNHTHMVNFVSSAKVRFVHAPKDAIEAYVETKEPYDKAGGYGIQGLASSFIAGISGDYYAVVGLPVCTLSFYLNLVLASRQGKQLPSLKEFLGSAGSGERKASRRAPAKPSPSEGGGEEEVGAYDLVDEEQTGARYGGASGVESGDEVGAYDLVDGAETAWGGESDGGGGGGGAYDLVDEDYAESNDPYHKAKESDLEGGSNQYDSEPTYDSGGADVDIAVAAMHPAKSVRSVEPKVLVVQSNATVPTEDVPGYAELSETDTKSGAAEAKARQGVDLPLLEKASHFFGACGRGGAQKLLADAKAGTYLFRSCGDKAEYIKGKPNPNLFVISFKTERGNIGHHKIRRLPGRGYQHDKHPEVFSTEQGVVAKVVQIPCAPVKQ